MTKNWWKNSEILPDRIKADHKKLCHLSARLHVRTLLLSFVVVTIANDSRIIRHQQELGIIWRRRRGRKFFSKKMNMSRTREQRWTAAKRRKRKSFFFHIAFIKKEAKCVHCFVLANADSKSLTDLSRTLISLAPDWNVYELFHSSTELFTSLWKAKKRLLSFLRTLISFWKKRNFFDTLSFRRDLIFSWSASNSHCFISLSQNSFGRQRWRMLGIVYRKFLLFN